MMAIKMFKSTAQMLKYDEGQFLLYYLPFATCNCCSWFSIRLFYCLTHTLNIISYKYLFNYFVVDIFSHVYYYFILLFAYVLTIIVLTYIDYFYMIFYPIHPIET